MADGLKYTVVASTGGSVMNELLKSRFFKSRLYSLVADRPCPAVEKAAAHGVPVKVFPGLKKDEFSDRLYHYLCEHQVDYVISFFTRLFVGDLLTGYADRIINLHPSILPAFKGLNSFEDAVAYGARFTGTSIHLIDEHMDEGKIILQTVCPIDPNGDPGLMRHRLFNQQCKSLLQVMKWLENGRVRVQGRRVLIEGSNYIDFEYSPALDDPEAIQLQVPYPF